MFSSSHFQEITLLVWCLFSASLQMLFLLLSQYRCLSNKSITQKCSLCASFDCSSPSISSITIVAFIPSTLLNPIAPSSSIQFPVYTPNGQETIRIIVMWLCICVWNLRWTIQSRMCWPWVLHSMPQPHSSQSCSLFVHCQWLFCLCFQIHTIFKLTIEPKCV